MMRIATIFLCLGLLTLPASSQTAASTAPQALVTFYSSGSHWKSAMPGYKYGAFAGRILDEYDQLAMISPGNFVTFKLDPGPHTLTANAWMIPRPEGGGHLEIDLVAGQHYYVGTYNVTTPLLVISVPYMEQRTCEEAQHENKSTKPLERKHLKKYGDSRAVVETSFPACP
jgi:hypothetical protein